MPISVEFTAIKDRQPFSSLFSRTIWVSQILMKQKTTGWQWHQLDHIQIIYTSFQTDNHASTSTLNFLQARCSSWRPTNRVKALKTTPLKVLPSTATENWNNCCCTRRWTNKWQIGFDVFPNWVEVDLKCWLRCTFLSATLLLKRRPRRTGRETRRMHVCNGRNTHWNGYY